MWKNITDSKWFYVIVSLLLAFILWIYVGKEANPVKTDSLRGIKVTISGLEKLEERGLMVSGGADQTVTLNLQARRDVFSRLDADKITVNVDVSNITEPGTVSLDYRVTYPLSVSNDAITERDRRPDKISLTISRWTTREVEVRASFTGSVAEGFQLGEFSFAPQTVEVRGREELVEQIDYAQVTVSQTDLSETYSRDIPFVFIDVNGEPMDMDELKTEEHSILVTLPVFQLKEVPLTVALVPGGGADDAEVTISPKSIMVSGSPDDLEPLKELSLGSVELYKIFGTDTITLPIRLSSELTNVSGVNEATVTVTIQGLATRTLEVDNIEIINIPVGYSADKVTTSRSVQIRGSQEAVDAVVSSQLRIVADLKDITATTGSQTVPVKVYLDGSSDVGVVGDYNIVISIAGA